MNLGRLRDPVVIVLATSLLWISMRFILRKQHRFLMQHLLQQNKLCELRYFQRKSVNRLRNQLLLSALISGTTLFIISENTMLAPYPDETIFGIILFVFLLVTGVFICQSAALPYFLLKQFLPVRISTTGELTTSRELHHINQLVLLQLTFSLSLWPVISAVFPALSAVTVFLSILTCVIIAALLYQTAIQTKRAHFYRDAALKSISRKLHFLRNKGQYPQQPLQLAIKKLQLHRNEVKASSFTLVTERNLYLFSSALLSSVLMWSLFG